MNDWAHRSRVRETIQDVTVVQMMMGLFVVPPSTIVADFLTHPHNGGKTVQRKVPAPLLRTSLTKA